VSAALGVTRDEILFLEVPHDGESGGVGSLIGAPVHDLMYGSYRTWAFIPENGEGVEFLRGWFYVA
jgi:hypothetical protein